MELTVTWSAYRSEGFVLVGRCEVQDSTRGDANKGKDIKVAAIDLVWIS